jgi:archaemetzincin
MFTRFIFYLLFFTSCANSEVKKADNIGIKNIEIQPFTDITNSDVAFISDELSYYFPNIIIRKNIEFPTNAFVKERNRYRADSLIKFLSNRALSNSIIVGLTSRDISTTKNGIKDWGVMGLGYNPGNACIASTFRLQKNKHQEQLFKVVIHEIGHTFGLPHCENRTCFMRDAEGSNPTNEEVGYCSKCQRFLLAKGWKKVK